MDVKVIRQGGVAVAHAAGRLDSNSAAAFEDGLMRVIDSEPMVVLDMSDLNYVSSAGLRVMLMAAKKSKATGRKLSLCSLTPEVRMVFDVSGFLALFTIHESRDAAVAACN